uniref:Metalloendopeptidase n=1 Tax=Caenorhabditis tropicalis TaxID=1561998 RepID=A0A1I7TEX5_9PELO
MLLILFFLPFALLGAPTNPKALNKILVEENPETPEKRKKIRKIIDTAFENRIPRVQGRQGVAPPLKLAVLNYGPKNNQTRKFEELNSEINGILTFNPPLQLIKTSEYTFESDIMLNENQANNLAKSIENGNYRAKRQAIVDTTLFWNTSVPIYYQFDSKLSATNIANVRKAIKFWNDNSCLNFKEDSNAKNRLFMSSAGGCWSYVGKQVDMPYQMVSVGPSCDTLGTATHELMHAIGFWHQQSRSDRDDYVYVDFSNIIPSQAYNFQKMPLDQAQLLNLPYDYGSVMQYYPYAFALDSSKYTILAKQNGFQNSMGQREAPAFSDLIGVNKLYNCSSTQSIVSFQSISIEATSTWQTFNAKAGDPNSYTSSSDNSTNCFWHIKAPVGQKVEFKMTTAPMSAICMQECPWQSIEINLGRFDLYGMITCCDTFLNQVFTSEQNTIALRGIIRYNQLNYSIQYRSVPTQGTATSPVCVSR